jgi:hypothetical protein
MVIKKIYLNSKEGTTELESEISDITAQFKMKYDINRQELNAANEANQLVDKQK